MLPRSSLLKSTSRTSWPIDLLIDSSMSTFMLNSAPQGTRLLKFRADKWLHNGAYLEQPSLLADGNLEVSQRSLLHLISPVSLHKRSVCPIGPPLNLRLICGTASHSVCKVSLSAAAQPLQSRTFLSPSPGLRPSHNLRDPTRSRPRSTLPSVHPSHPSRSWTPPTCPTGPVLPKLGPFSTQILPVATRSLHCLWFLNW